MTRAALALAALVTLSACSSATAGSSSARPDRDLITREEIASVPVSSAYEVVERLRPEFLRAARGGGTPNVYINNSRSGGIAILRSIRADNVQTIRYVDALDANLRYGLGNDSGVIAVELLRQP
ncbi:MAG TPA: hypothetical protein VMM79_06455 [Longimicrobiales bacterium]|nr:hypothetical protein [Longimicrobiales bacterium]